MDLLQQNLRTFAIFDLAIAAVLGVDLGRAAVSKFNEVSERVGFSDRIAIDAAMTQKESQT